MSHRKTILKIAGILLLCLSIFSFQNPIAPISPIPSAIRVDSFYLQTARLQAAGDWVNYERLILESGRDAGNRKDNALIAAVNLRKAEFESRKNSFDKSISGLLFEKALQYFEKSDTAIWQQDAARYGLASTYYQFEMTAEADSLLLSVFDNKRKPRSEFAADALFIYGRNHLWYSPKLTIPQIIEQLQRIPNHRREYVLLFQASQAISSKNYNQAETLLTKSAELLQNKQFDEAHRLLVELYLKLDEVNYDKNLSYLRQALSILSPGYNVKDLSAIIPDAEHIFPDYLSLETLMQLILAAPDSITEIGIKAAENLSGLGSIMQNHVYSKRGQYTCIQKSGFANYYLRQAAIRKYDENKSSAALQDIFFHSERINALVMWYETKSLDRKEPSDSLQALEQRLAIDQSFWTFQVNRLHALNETKLLPSFEQKLKEIKKERDALHVHLLKKQKNYLNLKFGPQIPKLKELQSKLEPGTQIIYYIDINAKFFQLSITAYKAELFSLDFNSKQMESWLQDIEYERAAADFNNLAYTLYLRILQEAIKSDTKKLIIVTNSTLDRLPFELLLTEAPKNTYSFKNLPYLFKKHSVSYQYSVSSWYERQNQPISPVNYYIMSMTSATDSLESLQTDYLLKRFSATTYIGPAAKKSVFLEQAPRYGFIHLGNKAEENGLLFGENDTVFGSEIENMDLNAALVLLPHSANSMNVELDFLYSGAASLLVSLWDEPKETESNEMLKYFYEYLQKGFSKDEALRRARMDYLEKMTEDKLLPVYLGQFRQVGDFRSVSISEPISYIWWYLLPIVGLLGIGWWAMGALRQRR